MLNYAIILVLISMTVAFCAIDYKGIVSGKVLLLIMYLLMAYVTMNADMPAYIGLYQDINSISKIGLTDPGFGLLMYIGRLLKLDYYGFLKAITIIGLLFVSIVIYKRSLCAGLVLALYFIFVFPAETIQIRAFFAETVLYILMYDMVVNLRFRWFRFFIVLLFAILMHATSLFFALLLLAVLVKSRKKLTAIIGITMVAVPVAGKILSYIPIPMIQAKLQPYFSAQRESVSMAALLYVAIYVFLTVYVYHITLKEQKRDHSYDLIDLLCEGKELTDWGSKLEVLLRIHIICTLSCMMIIFFSSNFYRITRTVMVVDFIVIGNYYVETGKLKPMRLMLTMLVLVVLFLGMELMTHSLRSIMEYNTLFSSFVPLTTVQ